MTHDSPIVPALCAALIKGTRAIAVGAAMYNYD